MKTERVGTGKIIEALATLVRASHDYEPKDEPDKLDHWRALVVAARIEYDSLRDEIRRLRAAARSSGETTPAAAFEAWTGNDGASFATSAVQVEALKRLNEPQSWALIGRFSTMDEATSALREWTALAPAVATGERAAAIEEAARLFDALQPWVAQRIRALAPHGEEHGATGLQTGICDACKLQSGWRDAHCYRAPWCTAPAPAPAQTPEPAPESGTPRTAEVDESPTWDADITDDAAPPTTEKGDNP